MTPDDPDAALLEAWRAGDMGAGEHLFDRYISPITRFFRNKVATGVEDLVQDTFLGLAAGRDRLRDSSSVRSYLFAIAHNVLRAHLRALGRARAVDVFTSMADINPNSSTILGRCREHRLLLRALRRLPLGDQIILELAFWEGLAPSEIAEIVGTSGSAVRGRLFRGRARLDQILTELSAEPGLVRSTLDGFERWVVEIRHELGCRGHVPASTPPASSSMPS